MNAIVIFVAVMICPLAPVVSPSQPLPSPPCILIPQEIEAPPAHGNDKNVTKVPDRDQNSPDRSLLELIFSSPSGIAAVVALFLLITAIVYFILKKHQSATGG